MVRIRYVPISKKGVTFIALSSGVPPAAGAISTHSGNPTDPIAITTNATAAIPIPIAIFFGVLGSIPRAFNQPNNAMTTGVSNTTKIGLNDWKTSAPLSVVNPKSKCRMSKLVYSFAKNVNVRPFWWKANQKKITTPITAARA
jgi:acetamidase/formamidase